MGVCLDQRLVWAEQVCLAGKGVVQVEMGAETNMVHMGGEDAFGWIGHMAMSSLQV